MTDFRPTAQQMRFIADNFDRFRLYANRPELAALLRTVATKAAENGTGIVPLRELAHQRTPEYNLLMASIADTHLARYGVGVGYSKLFMYFLSRQKLDFSRVNVSSGLWRLAPTMPPLPCNRPARRSVRCAATKAATL